MACTINLYDYLFTKESPEQVEGDEAPAEAADEEEEAEEDAAVEAPHPVSCEPCSLNPRMPQGPSFLDNLNPDSLIVKSGFCEPDLLAYAEKPGTAFQFERVGFFAVDKVSAWNRRPDSTSFFFFECLAVDRMEPTPNHRTDGRSTRHPALPIPSHPCPESEDSTKEKPIFNRVVTLKESKDKKAL